MTPACTTHSRATHLPQRAHFKTALAAHTTRRQNWPRQKRIWNGLLGCDSGRRGGMDSDNCYMGARGELCSDFRDGAAAWTELKNGPWEVIHRVIRCWGCGECWGGGGGGDKQEICVGEKRALFHGCMCGNGSLVFLAKKGFYFVVVSVC
ncbi:hypothetical protein BDU57DRAFT_316330 [Ampelomyces quisqualis]|uniref:Uncharacterized protein n=1 Tax=Ampelomyces quisqualis TaxID=50730 RepID=A0A6A5QE04_AMPQU|nr:hypothetical protein BDU57DRAFT_316330 [Ampelomyces quisqualis]